MVKGASSTSKQVLRAALAKRASTVAAATKNASSESKKKSSETQSKPAAAAASTSGTRQPKKETAKQQQQQNKEKKVKTATTKTEREPSTTSNVETSSSALGHEVKKLSKKERKRIALAGKKQSFPTAAPGAPCTIRDLMTASLIKNNNSLSSNNNNNNSSSQNKKKNNGKNTANNSASSLDPFNFTPSNDWQDAASGDDNNNDDNIYQTPDSLLQEGNKFFIKRNKEERALTKAAMKQIEEMKRVNLKGGDSGGFKYIIPKSAKKLASRLAGDVDITLDDKKDAVKGKLLPSANSMIADGDDVNEMGGLNQDDRPMRKKKPRASKELKDFYTWQKWKSWTKNAENFLQRGKLSRKVFDSKRKFKSV